MGYNLLGRVIGVKRLERGGCLFEGIASMEMKEYILQTRCVRIGRSSPWRISNLLGTTHEEFYAGHSGSAK